MSAKHTPGPWVVSRRDPARFQVATVELFGIYSRHPESGDMECGAPEDDARLIAAAPDLLAFAQSLIDDYCSDDGMASAKHIVKLAQEVVAKATGGEA